MLRTIPMQHDGYITELETVVPSSACAMTDLGVRALFPAIDARRAQQQPTWRRLTREVCYHAAALSNNEAYAC